MSGHTFRNPDLFQVLPLRDYLRSPGWPDGKDGFVVEDLDVVVRHFGNTFHTDAKGRLLLIEQKHPGHWIRTAQEKTFGLMDTLLRKADPERVRYLGYYILQVAFDADNAPVFPVRMNKQAMDATEFRKWITGETVIPSYFEKE